MKSCLYIAAIMFVGVLLAGEPKEGENKPLKVNMCKELRVEYERWLKEKKAVDGVDMSEQFVKEYIQKHKQWKENAEKRIKPVSEEVIKKSGIMGVWKIVSENNMPDVADAPFITEFAVTKQCIVTYTRKKDTQGNILHQGGNVAFTCDFVKTEDINADFLFGFRHRYGARIVKNNETLQLFHVAVSGDDGGKYVLEDKPAEFKKVSNTISEDILNEMNELIEHEEQLLFEEQQKKKDAQKIDGPY